MSEQVFEGKSVAEALAEAAAALGVGVEQLEHELVEEKSDDFWGLGETIYRVRAWVAGSEPEPDSEPEPASEPEAGASEAQTAGEPEPGDEVAPETPPVAKVSGDENETGRDASPAAEEPLTLAGDAVGSDADAAPTGEGIEAASVSLLTQIFESMGFDCAAEAEIDGGALQVSISGDDNQYLLDGRGRGLAALELILNHAFRHRPDIGQHKIRVDAGNFRSQRDDELRDLAYQVAHRAKETGEAQQTEPMNPYERRIVHLTLADDPQVSTRSLGSGFLKAVNVVPSRGGRR